MSSGFLVNKVTAENIFCMNKNKKKAFGAFVIAMAKAVQRRTKGNASSAPSKQPVFTETEIEDLKTAFGLLDRNCDGRVTASELQFMLQNLGIHIRDEVIDELIKEASNSGNGRIDETEFLQWISRIQALSHEADDEGDSDDGTKDLIAAFRVFDRDRNGYITMDELRSAMDMIGEPVTDAQLSDLLSIADIDKDGKINYEEFVRLLL